MVFAVPECVKGRVERGDVLVVPAVGLGNVGQLCLDLLLNTLGIASSCGEGSEATARAGQGAGQGAGRPRAEFVAHIKSMHVFPVVGNGALDLPQGERMHTSLELFRVPSKKLCFMQIRSPVIDGHAQDFADEVVAFALEYQLGEIVVLGGADSSAGFASEGAALHEVCYFSSAVAGPDAIEADLPLRKLKTTENLVRAGLARKLYSACSEKAFPLRSLTVFCKEGVNIPEACMLSAAAVATCVRAFEVPPATWSPPTSWESLHGGAVDSQLYQ